MNGDISRVVTAEAGHTTPIVLPGTMAFGTSNAGLARSAAEITAEGSRETSDKLDRNDLR
jgi:hypothetical protein